MKGEVINTDFDFEPKAGLKVFDSKITKVLEFKKKKPESLLDDKFSWPGLGIHGVYSRKA